MNIENQVGFIGCHANDLVVFDNGRRATVREIVEQRVGGKVLTYSSDKGVFESQEIVGWLYNGKMTSRDDCLYIETVGPDCARGRFGFAATQDCQVMTRCGWRSLKGLTTDDELLTKYKSVVNGTVADFLWGTMIGDCSVKKKEENRYNLRFEDNSNPNYLRWKIGKLSVAFDFTLGYRNGYDSNYSFELKLIKEELGRRDPCVMLKNHFSDLGLAVWYMDDGNLNNGPKKRASISVKRFKGNREKLEEIAFLLAQNGVPCSYLSYNYGDIVFKGERLKNLFSRICCFVPECMQYKLLDEYMGERFTGKYVDFHLSNQIETKESHVRVLLIRPISYKQMQQPGKYMLSTENGNFMIGSSENGIVIKSAAATIDQVINAENAASCGVAGVSYVKYETKANASDRGNHKGGTAQRLYERFNNICCDGRTSKFGESEILFLAPNVSGNGIITHKQIVHVVKLNEQECYAISSASGNCIVASATQKILVGFNQYTQIRDLAIGDQILVQKRGCRSLTQDVISSIERVAKQDVYAVLYEACDNYIANGFVLFADMDA